MRQMLMIAVLLVMGCNQSPNNVNEFSKSVLPDKFEYVFQDPRLTIEERVDNLISLLSLQEKVDQLMYNAPAIPRLGIPEYNWWNECLHGVARNGRATVFPQAIGLAATWDTTLIHNIGEAISDEARAKFNQNVAHNERGRYQGLTFWTPNVNIFRDPRWGRGQETYGEDPYLTSRIGVSFVNGLQGKSGPYLKAAGMAKHYAVHNGPEGLRHEFDARVSQKDLWETYMPAFEALVTEANVEGVMGAYNRTNGDPCCAHPYLMNDILREKWGFKGYFVSDCWALVDFYEGHKIVNTAEEAAAMALKAGTNLNCGSTYPALVRAIEQGLTTEAEVDRNLKQLLPTRFKLGLFDPLGANPYDAIGPEVIRGEKHIELTRSAAAKSMVLLKNKDNTLPLSKDISSVFVCGPTATHAQALLANYYGVSENLVTFLEGITGKVSDHTRVNYSQGALLDIPNRNPIDWFSGTGSESEVTIACVGISQLIEGEEGESIASDNKGDRVDIGLPQNQIDFLKKMRETSEKLVVVLTSGSAVACKEIYDLADVLIYTWYPGEQGGNGLADVIFGDVSPSGKLPVTVPYSIDDLPPFEDYALKGRTYKYMDKEPLFPFGFGLSYANFEYKDLVLTSSSVSGAVSNEVNVNVSNTSETDAEETIQLYLSTITNNENQPKYALKAFKKIYIKAGGTEKVSFTLTPKMYEMINESGEGIVNPGKYKIYIGGSIPSQRSIDLGAPQWAEGEFAINK